MISEVNLLQETFFPKILNINRSQLELQLFQSKFNFFNQIFRIATINKRRINVSMTKIY